jgi:alpha-tubulin suppressor-like RCC1 family protein
MQLSSGTDHTVAIDENGQYWSWGSNSDGQLGVVFNSFSRSFEIEDLNDTENKCFGIDPDYKNNYDTYNMIARKPVRIRHPTSFKSVFCGNKKTFLLDYLGSVWHCGRKSGTIVFDFILDIHDLKEPHCTFFPSKSIENIPPVKTIACSNFATFFLCENGQVWVLGSNSLGALGISEDESTNSIEPLKIEHLENIVDISCGHHHTLAVDRIGDVWGFGSNRCGQLGLSLETIYIPEKVSSLSNVKRVLCGSSFSYVIDSDSRVYCMGTPLNKRMIVNDSQYSMPREDVELFECDIRVAGHHMLSINPTDMRVSFYGLLARGYDLQCVDSWVDICIEDIQIIGLDSMSFTRSSAKSAKSITHSPKDPLKGAQ